MIAIAYLWYYIAKKQIDGYSAQDQNQNEDRDLCSSTSTDFELEELPLVLNDHDCNSECILSYPYLSIVS